MTSSCLFSTHLDTGLTILTILHIHADGARGLVVDLIDAATLVGEVHAVERPVNVGSVAHARLDVLFLLLQVDWKTESKIQ